MFSITGATGKVGGAMARALVAQGEAVRAIVRDPSKAHELRSIGCDLAAADLADSGALARTFDGADGVFILLPPVFDPEPGYCEARRVAAAVATALSEARPAKVVALSTVGADAKQDNLLTQLTILEEALSRLDRPITFLRAAWFMDNAAWDLPSARDEGVLRSFLQPADRAIPMVAAQDVGTTAAALLREDWRGHRVVGLSGPAPLSPNDIARAFERALSRPVGVEIVPRGEWETSFRTQGMRNPGPRIRMLDGFNEGWIGFSDDRVEMRSGQTSLDDVVAALVSSAVGT